MPRRLPLWTDRASPSPPPPPWRRWLRQRGRQASALARRVVTAEVPYLHREPTALGLRRKALLERLATGIDEAVRRSPGWRLAGVEISPPGFELRNIDGRRARLELDRPREDRVFRRTRYFSVRYTGLREAEADLPMLHAAVDALAKAEGLAEGDPDLPDALFDRGAAQVAMYLQDLRVELRPTLACDHHCAFCNSVDRKVDNATHGLGDLRRIADTWQRMPVYRAVISGGEPTLLRDLPELVSGLADKGYLVELQTNGMALADAPYARRLVAAGLHTALISLHASDAARSDARITRVPGAWARTVAGVDNGLAAGLTIELSHVIHRDNYDDTTAFLAMVHRRWGRRVRVRMAFVAPTGAASEDPAATLPPLTEVLPHTREALSLAEARRLRVEFVGYCGIPPCLLVPHESFSEVTLRGSTEYPPNHVKLPACDGCVYASACPGLWEGYLKAHGDPGVRAIRTEPRWPLPLRRLRHWVTR